MKRGKFGAAPRERIAPDAPGMGPLASQYFARGIEEQQRGRFAEAEASYRRALHLEPGHSGLLNNLGLVLQGLGRLDEAAEAYRQATALRPDLREAIFNLGNVLAALGRADEAVAAYRRAMPFLRSYPELHFNLGNALRDLGRLDEAMTAYRRAIMLKPSYADAHTNLGAIQRERGALEEAVASFRRASTITPNVAEAWNNLGLAQHARGTLEPAVASYQRALALRPGYAEAHNHLGVALQALGHVHQAVAAYQAAIAAQPNDAAAYNNLGTALQHLGRLVEAEAAFRQAIARNPAEAEAHHNLGVTLQAAGRLEAALAAFREALTHRPDYLEALSSLTQLRRTLCDWHDAEREAERCRSLVRAGRTGHDPLAFMALDPTLEEQQHCARLWTRAKTAGIAKLPERERRSADKLRLGYLSADLCQHSVAVLTAELFERHDRSRFEVTAYSTGRDDGSPMRRRLEQAFDRFVDIASLSYRDAAQRIRADGIDILVDLSGHTRGARLPILAARPAPVQVNFLGYPGTMGADFIDYVIADPIIAPMADQPFFDEKIVHLPDTYVPFDTRQQIAAATPSRAECGLPEAGFVFCCFNTTHKITPALFDIWMRLLLQAPGSVLWLAEENPTARANLAREAEVRGVAAERIVFAGLQPLPQHLARHRLADLFLDTLPYNACTTAGLALWAGLPVLTCAGQTFAGRMAASLLHAAGFADMVTDSLAAYEALALRFANDAALLGDARRRLADGGERVALFDAARFTRNLEAAYVAMWENGGSGTSHGPLAGNTLAMAKTRAG